MSKSRNKNANVKVNRFFTTPGEDGLEHIKWENRSASIVNPTTGEKVFEADSLTFPDTWSQNCTALVAEKYFRFVEQEDGSKVRETSVAQMIERVAGTIARWGTELGYFSTKTEDADNFQAELSYILVNQMAAFNSPVWFNVGTNRGRLGTEQCSACFILGLDDTMESILDLAVTEGRLYKGGSGSGVNYSQLRSSREKLSGGGTASGPVPFIMKDDFNAGAVKSGGTTRRAAKIAILDVDHGDIMEFVQCKANGERAAHALIDSKAFTGDFRDRWGAYAMVPFQNANHSVRVTDEFMRAVTSGGDWELKARDGSVLEVIKAKDLWNEICSAAWFCGDPGLQFDTTINNWNTSPAGGRISGSNPCAEFNYLDNTSCNLASINLMAYLHGGEFNVEWFEHTVDVMITAMEILVDAASYPAEKIAENSHKYRPLGLGITNLGAFLMAQGIPYDSHKGQSQAGAVTAILSGRGYARSAEIAQAVGPFPEYPANADAMMRVMQQHQAAVTRVVAWDDPLQLEACRAWERAVFLGSQHGYRNGQISVMAPTGTISFMMDCDTTGIEPDLSLKKTKKLVGGGTIQITNQQVGRALKTMGYQAEQISEIEDYVLKHGSVVDAPHMKPEDYAVFDCAFPDPVGQRTIRPEAHVLMMSAIQPFTSGAISKTCNIPKHYTPDDISDLYMLAWKEGLKSIALYRDGCKRTQPLSTTTEDGGSTEVESDTAPTPLQVRRKLPNDCVSHRHRFTIGQHSGYLHVGLYPDGKPGELFIKMAKEGSTTSGLMDAIGVLTSLALQYGVPLDVIASKFAYTQFEPAGVTGNPDLRFAQSPLDYVFRFLEQKFLQEHSEAESEAAPAAPETPQNATGKMEGQVCGRCGNGVQRAGACLTCPTCGWTSGCG